MEIAIGLLILGVIGFGALSSTASAAPITPPQSSKDAFTKYDYLFQKYAPISGVDWRFMKAISKKESDIGRNALVKAGKTSTDGKSWGIMQIAPNVGSAMEIKLKGQPTLDQMNEPAFSIERAAMLIGYLNTKYKGDLLKVARAYNQGEKNTDNGKNYTIPNGKYGEIVLDYFEKLKQGKII